MSSSVSVSVSTAVTTASASVSISVAPGSTIVSETAVTTGTTITPVISVDVDISATTGTGTKTTLTTVATKATRTTQYINVGPLTTAFTHPAKCATLIGTEWLLDPPELEDWHPTCRTADDADCVPPRTTLKPAKIINTITTADAVVPYYSPGVSCPKGWTTAYASSNGQALPATTTAPAKLEDIPAPGLAGDQTLAICCPTSYNVGGLYCTSATAVSSVSNFCQVAASTGIDGYITLAGVASTTVDSDIATATHAAVEVVNQVVLVHQKADLKASTANVAAPRLGVVLAAGLAAVGTIFGLMG